MKILIVEDDQYKSEAISEFLITEFRSPEIVIKDSLASGIFEVLDNGEFDIILLDMSMPSFDVTSKDPSGGTPESYAGEDFLSQMTVLGVNIPIVVVTQYDNFGTDDSQMSLTALDKKLRHNHSEIYEGSVYFKSSSISWKKELKGIITGIINANTNS